VDTGSAPRAVQPPSLARKGDPARLHSSQSRSARAGDANSSRDAVRIQMHPREGGRGEDASRGSGGSGSLMFDLSIASPPAVAVSSSGRARGRRGEGSSLGAAAPASGPGSTSAGTLGGLEGDSHSHSHSREGLDTRLDSGSSFMSPGSATGSPAPRQEPRQLLEVCAVLYVCAVLCVCARCVCARAVLCCMCACVCAGLRLQAPTHLHLRGLFGHPMHPALHMTPPPLPPP
jgi:hypothetical protein